MNGCAKNGGMHRGEFPEGVNAYIQYGQNLSSLLVNLSMDGMDENGVLPDFKGIAVHDCWKAYWRYLEAIHAICAIHILRELVGVIENYPPLQNEIKRGRKKKEKVLALIERLAHLKDSMLLFARNFEVLFTNNAAERTIRNLKSKSKVAGNFRSDDGARWYLKIRSYIDSARKHGINAFEAVKLAFAGTPALCLGF